MTFNRAFRVTLWRLFRKDVLEQRITLLKCYSKLFAFLCQIMEFIDIWVIFALAGREALD
jgi:hypothetical protein